MKNFFLIILINILIVKNSSAQNLTIELKDNKTVYELGTPIKLILKLTDLKSGFENEMNADFSVIDLKELSKEITIIPNNIGEFEIGPYKIVFKDKKLISNTISVNITEMDVKSDNTNKIIIEAPKAVKKGDKFLIKIITPHALTGIVETKGVDLKGKSIVISKNRYLEQVSSSISNSISIKNGIKKSEFIYMFTVKAKTKGELKINGDLFKPKVKINIEKSLIIK